MKKKKNTKLSKSIKMSWITIYFVISYFPVFLFNFLNVPFGIWDLVKPFCIFFCFHTKHISHSDRLVYFKAFFGFFILNDRILCPIVLIGGTLSCLFFKFRFSGSLSSSVNECTAKWIYECAHFQHYINTRHSFRIDAFFKQKRKSRGRIPK